MRTSEKGVFAYDTRARGVSVIGRSVWLLPRTATEGSNLSKFRACHRRTAKQLYQRSKCLGAMDDQSLRSS